MIKLSKFLENSKKIILKEAQFITVKPLYSLRKLFSTRESFCIIMVFQTCTLLNYDETIFSMRL